MIAKVRTTFKEKLPGKADLWLVFSLCAFATHVWGYIRLLYYIPGLILRLTPIEILQVASYNLFFMLLDSLFFTGILILICLVLPARKLKDHFSLSGSTVILISAAGAIGMHYTIPVMVTWIHLTQGDLLDRFWVMRADLWLLTAGVGVWFLAAAKIPVFIRRKERLSGLILGFVERTTVLSTLFLILDGFGMVIITLGNFF